MDGEREDDKKGTRSERRAEGLDILRDYGLVLYLGSRIRKKAARRESRVEMEERRMVKEEMVREV